MAISSTTATTQFTYVNFHGFHHNPRNHRFPHHILPVLQFRKSINITNCLPTFLESTQKIVNEFDPKIPVEEAFTPPSSWYTDPSFYSFELDRVFYKGWQVVGCVDQIKDAHSYFTGRLGNVEYVICRDSNGEIHAFHNVCRHHASPVACGSGKKTCFVCPYHGWTYGLGGSLLRAPRITGLQKFDPKEYGLLPIRVATWGPFVVVNLCASQEEVNGHSLEDEWLGSSSKLLSGNVFDSSLSYICRREYTLECNWKVFCDNYLDGGYHVPYAHKNLALGLDLESYSTQGYGPWMDTNLVLPLGPRKCLVVFDYFLDGSLKEDKAFIDRSLKDSEQVQMEDVILCEGVQRGLESPAYKYGRYAPGVEKAMHHFHCLLHRSMT